MVIDPDRTESAGRYSRPGIAPGFVRGPVRRWQHDADPRGERRIGGRQSESVAIAVPDPDPWSGDHGDR